MKTPEEIEKIKAMAKRASVFIDGNGAYLRMIVSEDDSFTAEDETDEFPDEVTTRYEDVDLNICRFLELVEIKEPMSVDTLLELVIEKDESTPVTLCDALMASEEIGDMHCGFIAAGECLLESLRAAGIKI